MVLGCQISNYLNILSRLLIVFTVRRSPLSWLERMAAAGFVIAVKFWWVWMMCTSLSSTWVCACLFFCVRHGSLPCTYSIWGDVNQCMWITNHKPLLNQWQRARRISPSPPFFCFRRTTAFSSLQKNFQAEFIRPICLFIWLVYFLL